MAHVRYRFVSELLPKLHHSDALSILCMVARLKSQVYYQRPNSNLQKMSHELITSSKTGLSKRSTVKKLSPLELEISSFFPQEEKISAQTTMYNFLYFILS